MGWGELVVFGWSIEGIGGVEDVHVWRLFISYPTVWTDCYIVPFVWRIINH